jgi:hypothetical protein
MCLVCGQPLGLSEARGIVEKGEEEGEEESFLEKRSLAEECPYRLCLMRFRLLGKREKCHIVDQYTHLEKKSSDERFDRVFNKRIDSIVSVSPAYKTFASDIFKTGEFEVALATCRRVAKPLTFSGCRACNLAMEKSSAHANTIYRCFKVTQNVDVAAMEENKQDAIKTKKALEQIAIYFVWNESEMKWTAKDDDGVLVDTCLWRCIAHIYSWGRTAKYRSRLVAIFHAANYMYTKSSYKGSVTLEDWHTHVFQPYYMLKYKANCWFGLDQSEAGAIFDMARKEGARWIEFVTNRLDTVVLPDIEMWAEKRIRMDQIQAFKDKIVAKVGSERELIDFVGHKHGTIAGLENLYSFYLFNIKEEAAHAKHFYRFMKEMSNVTALYQKKTTVGHGV